MNQKEALRKARKLWGKRAIVEARDACTLIPHGRDRRIADPKRPEQGPVRWFCSYHGKDENGHKCPGGRPLRLVGHNAMGLFFHIEGIGTTWAEAFEKAAKQ